jgi:hypothetical protein
MVSWCYSEFWNHDQCTLGTGIFVYGTIQNTAEGPSGSSYAIDSEQKSTYHNNATSPDLKNQLFFRSEILPSGQHTLLVTTINDGKFIFDYLLYINDTTSSDSANGSPPSTSGLTRNTSTPTSDNPLPAASKPQSNGRTAVIVGSVVGTVCVILALLFLYWWFLRRRRTESKPQVCEVEPFAFQAHGQRQSREDSGGDLPTYGQTLLSP